MQNYKANNTLADIKDWVAPGRELRGGVCLSLYGISRTCFHSLVRLALQHTLGKPPGNVLCR